MRPFNQRLATIPALVAAVGLAGSAAFAANQGSPQDRVSDSVSLVQQMKQDPALAAVLQQAKGIFIIPHYGRGALIVGGQGGGGIVLANNDGKWSAPAFYTMSGGSIGAQAGGEGGAIAMILMTPKAVGRFASFTRDWSLNGSAGLTVATWSGRTAANTNRDDVILWTNTKGLYGGLTVSLTHIGPDTQLDDTYYGRQVTSAAILAGQVSNPNADPLRQALASRVASR